MFTLDQIVFHMMLTKMCFLVMLDDSQSCDTLTSKSYNWASYMENHRCGNNNKGFSKRVCLAGLLAQAYLHAVNLHFGCVQTQSDDT